ncbi:MAG: CPBP family intramembrane metalloprotease [Candidatus Harrisonbacteria bacterium]|nr:CPBP family intramembrane metalloprotease [Candidatus Harrisonbacteria bacterium]
MLFWLSIALSLCCILKTKNTNSLNRWDILFFLSSWQIFNLKIWQNYLIDLGLGYAYEISATILILLALFYLKNRGIKLNFSFSKYELLLIRDYLAMLAVLILPIGFAIGFLKFHPIENPKLILETFAGYFLFVAPSEELIFRGLILNLLRKWVNDWLALLITTAIFACIYSHLSGGGIFPNWKYVGLAFLAGLIYGLAYLESENIIVPILVHGATDAVWRIFLS